MPVSRKRRIAKRRKRETVGHRSAATGRFVSADAAKANPGETVAVTKPVESRAKKPDDYDQEC